MGVDVAEAIKDLIQKILGDRDSAVQYVEDPEGTLAAQGITDGNLEGLDMRQIVSDSCSALDLPDSTRSAVQSYSSGAPSSSGGYSAPPPGPASGVDQVMQHLNYVTYVAYEGDDYISQEITNIDQSQNVDFDVEGDMYGDFDVDSHDQNANATGDEAAAAVGGPATSGDEALVNTGVNLGQQNTGDQAAQVQAVASDVGPINTGEFTGIQADGPVDASESAMSFGAGDATATSTDINAPVIGSAVSTGGDAYNQVGNTVEEGAAQSQGGDATGIKSDDDVVEVDLSLGRPPLEHEGVGRLALADESEGEGDGDGDGSEVTLL